MVLTSHRRGVVVDIPGREQGQQAEEQPPSLSSFSSKTIYCPIMEEEEAANPQYVLSISAPIPNKLF